MQQKVILDGKYIVYDTGEIINSKTKRRINTYPATPSSNYVRVHLGGKTTILSRLIYEVFSDKKLKHREKIGFKDGNINNCAYSNLYIEPIKKRATKLSEKEVVEIKNKYFNPERKIPYQEIADLYNVSIATISRIINDIYIRKEEVYKNAI